MHLMVTKWNLENFNVMCKKKPQCFQGRFATYDRGYVDGNMGQCPNE